MSLKQFITTSYSKDIFLDIKKYSKERSEMENLKPNCISEPKNKFSMKLKDTYHQFMIKCILQDMLLKECSQNTILLLNHRFLHSSPKSFLRTLCRFQTLRPSVDLQGTSRELCVTAGLFVYVNLDKSRSIYETIYESR